MSTIQETERVHEPLLDHILNQYSEQLLAHKIKIEDESILNEILNNKASLREIIDTKPLREIFQNKELFVPGVYTFDEIKKIVGKASKNRYPDNVIQRHLLYHSFNREFPSFIGIFFNAGDKYIVPTDKEEKDMFRTIVLNDYFRGQCQEEYKMDNKPDRIQKILDSEEVLNNLLTFDEARLEAMTFLKMDDGYYVLADEQKEYLRKRVKDARGY